MLIRPVLLCFGDGGCGTYFLKGMPHTHWRTSQLRLPRGQWDMQKELHRQAGGVSLWMLTSNLHFRLVKERGLNEQLADRGYSVL